MTACDLCGREVEDALMDRCVECGARFCPNCSGEEPGICEDCEEEEEEEEGEE